MNYGLVGYPVLQTADIIIYKADTVPVGRDQVPHVELSREIVRRFNGEFGEIFPEPEALLSKSPSIVGIDGQNKMSKSLDNHIELAATPEETIKRVKGMVTDPQRARRTDPGRPWVCNVYSMHQLFSPESVQSEVHEACINASIGCVQDKDLLAKSINDTLEPFRERRRELEKTPDIVDEALREGNKKAREIAIATMEEVRQAIGFIK
jgi:tryptophanyl-tRNA synthetase